MKSNCRSLVGRRGDLLGMTTLGGWVCAIPGLRIETGGTRCFVAGEKRKQQQVVLVLD